MIFKKQLFITFITIIVTVLIKYNTFSTNLYGSTSNKIWASLHIPIEYPNSKCADLPDGITKIILVEKHVII
jgi:hypothetical protein